jgi:hypothetical protein
VTYYNYFNGTVVDESGDPLPDVIVSYQIIYGTSKTKSVTTNNKGTFRIEQELNEMSDGIILTISMDNYQTIIIHSEYRDWYKNQENSGSTSIRYDFGTIKLKALE